MPTVDWRPAYNADFGFATAPALPAISNWLTLASSGRIYAGSDEFNFVGAMAVESCCGLDSTAERLGVPKRVQAKGCNIVRFLGFNNKAQPQGPFTPGSGGTVLAGDTCTDATFLSAMDETIANYNARGVRVWISFDHGDKPRKAANLPRNTQNGSSSNADHGMAWSDEWMDCYETHIALFMDRIYNSVAWKDNPGIPVWQAFNENSIAQAFQGGWFDDIVNEVGGTGGGASGGSGYWRAELNAKLAAWAATQSWTVPGTTFPLYATYTGWGGTDKALMVQFIDYLEAEAAARMRAFFKARSPNCLFIYTQSSYCSAKVNAYYSDIICRNQYQYMGTTQAFAAPFATRSSGLADPNGFFTFAAQFEERSKTSHIDGGANAIVQSETGNYTINRWDATTVMMAAVAHNLQGGQGYTSFAEGQNQSQSTVTGIQLPHIIAGWPSRKLGELAASFVMKHRMIGELSTELVYKIDPSTIPAAVAGGATWSYTGYRVGTNISNGGEWHWLKRKIYNDFGTPAMTTAHTSIVDATLTTGVTLTTADGLRGTLFVRGNAGVPLITYNFPGCVGQTETVDNRTVGVMQVSGLSAPYAGLSFAVAMGDFPAFSGPTLIFVHGGSYPTDMTIDGSVGGATTEDRFALFDGNNVSAVGTESNTRVWVPAAHTIAITWPTNATISGVSAGGTLTDMGGTYSAGVRTFTTSTSYPVYLWSPIASTAQRTRPRKKTKRGA